MDGVRNILNYFRCTLLNKVIYTHHVPLAVYTKHMQGWRIIQILHLHQITYDSNCFNEPYILGIG